MTDEGYRPDLSPSTRSTELTDARHNKALDDPESLLRRRWERVQKELSSQKLTRLQVIELNRKLDAVEAKLAQAPSNEEHQALDGDQLASSYDSEVRHDSILSWRDAVKPEGNVKSKAIAINHAHAPGDVALGLQDPAEVVERVSNLAAELRKRQQESQHLLQVLYAKAQSGAAEVVRARRAAEQLRSDSADDLAELTYLKLKIQAIEKRAMKLFPDEEQTKLLDDLKHLGVDAEFVSRRFRKRRKGRDSDINGDEQETSLLTEIDGHDS